MIKNSKTDFYSVALPELLVTVRLINGIPRINVTFKRRLYHLYVCFTLQTTSGGTESLLLACKTYRDWAKEEKGITKPEM
jgi:hypothetical protein